MDKKCRQKNSSPVLFSGTNACAALYTVQIDERKKKIGKGKYDFVSIMSTFRIKIIEKEKRHFVS